MRVSTRIEGAKENRGIIGTIIGVLVIVILLIVILQMTQLGRTARQALGAASTPARVQAGVRSQFLTGCPGFALAVRPGVVAHIGVAGSPSAVQWDRLNHAQAQYSWSDEPAIEPRHRPASVTPVM